MPIGEDGQYVNFGVWEIRELEAQFAEDGELLDFLDRNPTIVSVAIGQPNVWVWRDRGIVAHIATDLRDALRKARVEWES